jgi:hypothetical protein
MAASTYPDAQKGAALDRVDELVAAGSTVNAACRTASAELGPAARTISQWRTTYGRADTDKTLVDARDVLTEMYNKLFKRSAEVAGLLLEESTGLNPDGTPVEKVHVTPGGIIVHYGQAGTDPEKFRAAMTGLGIGYDKSVKGGRIRDVARDTLDVHIDLDSLSDEELRKLAGED